MADNCTEGSVEDWLLVWRIVHFTALALSIVPLAITVASVVYLVMKLKTPKKPSAGGRYAFQIDMLCIAFALSSFLRTGLDLEFIIGNNSDWGCTVAMRIKNFLYWTASTLMFLILWLRQRVFYDNPALKSLRSPAVRAISWILLGLIFVADATAIAMHLTTTSYETSICGCERKDTARAANYGLYIAGTVLFQVLLLALLVYPLIRRRTNQGVVVRRFIKRAFVATAVCLLTDGASSVMAMTLSKYEAYNLVYEINLIVNLIAVILSFPDWRRRFVACPNVRHWLSMRELSKFNDFESSTKNSLEI